jgi:hypothetical protein
LLAQFWPPHWLNPWPPPTLDRQGIEKLLHLDRNAGDGVVAMAEGVGAGEGLVGAALLYEGGLCPLAAFSDGE